jgi:heat shock protein HtpX
MNIDAIEWVVWHEMAHIINGDMVTMTLLQWVVNTFVIFIARVVANIISNFLDEDLWWMAHMAVVIVLEIIFWLFASIIVMAFSRHREFKADAWSAKFLWKEKMIAWLEALKKMQAITAWDKSKLETMKISAKNKWGIMKLFSSHPKLQDRIDALNNSNI